VWIGAIKRHAFLQSLPIKRHFLLDWRTLTSTRCSSRLWKAKRTLKHWASLSIMAWYSYLQKEQDPVFCLNDGHRDTFERWIIVVRLFPVSMPLNNTGNFERESECELVKCKPVSCQIILSEENLNCVIPFKKSMNLGLEFDNKMKEEEILRDYFVDFFFFFPVLLSF
jgi:hypothetical protein